MSLHHTEPAAHTHPQPNTGTRGFSWHGVCGTVTQKTKMKRCYSQQQEHEARDDELRKRREQLASHEREPSGFWSDHFHSLAELRRERIYSKQRSAIRNRKQGRKKERKTNSEHAKRCEEQSKGTGKGRSRELTESLEERKKGKQEQACELAKRRVKRSKDTERDMKAMCS